MRHIGKFRAAVIAALALASLTAAVTSQALGGSKDGSPSSSGLGALTGLLPRDHLTEESAIQVDLSKESVRLPLYKGEANGQTVWYVLLDASDQGIAHDLGVNYAPKLGNIAIGDPEAVQTVTLDSPSPDQNKFGQALVHFQGAPDFSPTRIAEPGPTGFPLAKFQPGAVNGQTGTDNPNAQGFVNLVKDGHAAEDASAGNTALIDALRNGGDLLNVFGDFPTLNDPRHAQAYSPLWDAQLGLWTDKAIKQGLNTRQTDEVQVFNLAATHPDLITGINPATGQPAPYGATGVDINCAVIGFTDKAPTANLAVPVPNSQFPPR